MKELKYGDDVFDYKQMEEIIAGIKNGLNESQIDLYAHPIYNDCQMSEIRQGIENGLSKEQILMYASSAYSDWQMNNIRDGLEIGLTLKQVRRFAKVDIDGDKMFEIKRQVIKEVVTEANKNKKD